jgi:hypothetical protein
MRAYQIPAGLESYRTSRGDNTLRLTFGTQELSPETMANIHYSLNKVGFLVFAPDPFATHELEEIDNLKVDFEDTSKSQSQRIRAVLYLLWKQKPEGYKAFPDYYNAKTDLYIEHLKSKIEP